MDFAEERRLSFPTAISRLGRSVSTLGKSGRGGVRFFHPSLSKISRIKFIMLKSIFRGLVVFLLNWIALIPQLRAEETQLGGGINRADLDMSVKPGDDFFQYVNGSWLKKNPIPAEYSRWGAFSKLRDDNLANLRKILEGLSDQGTLEGNKRKLRDFFATAMDRGQTERARRQAAGR